MAMWSSEGNLARPPPYRIRRTANTNLAIPKFSCGENFSHRRTAQINKAPVYPMTFAPIAISMSQNQMPLLVPASYPPSTWFNEINHSFDSQPDCTEFDNDWAQLSANSLPCFDFEESFSPHSVSSITLSNDDNSVMNLKQFDHQDRSASLATLRGFPIETEGSMNYDGRKKEALASFLEKLELVERQRQIDHGELDDDVFLPGQSASPPQRRKRRTSRRSRRTNSSSSSSFSSTDSTCGWCRRQGYDPNHSPKNCPALQNLPGPCNNCGKTGHTPTHCPDQEKIRLQFKPEFLRKKAEETVAALRFNRTI